MILYSITAVTITLRSQRVNRIQSALHGLLARVSSARGPARTSPRKSGTAAAHLGCASASRAPTFAKRTGTAPRSPHTRTAFPLYAFVYGTPPPFWRPISRHRYHTRSSSLSYAPRDVRPTALACRIFSRTIYIDAVVYPCGSIVYGSSAEVWSGTFCCNSRK